MPGAQKAVETQQAKFARRYPVKCDLAASGRVLEDAYSPFQKPHKVLTGVRLVEHIAIGRDIAHARLTQQITAIFIYV